MSGGRPPAAESIKDLAKLADLTPARRNVNRGTKRSRDLLARSLELYGFGRPLLVDRSGETIAGANTLEVAAEQSGGTAEVKVVRTKGRTVVVHQRMDLDYDDPKALGLALADNRVGQVGFDVDPEVLAAYEAEGVEVGKLFTEDELARVLKRQVKELEGPPVEAPASDVRLVQAFFGPAQFKEFDGLAGRLQKRFATEDLAATVLEALRRARRLK